jgi:hypothetical protein
VTLRIAIAIYVLGLAAVVVGVALVAGGPVGVLTAGVLAASNGALLLHEFSSGGDE